MQISKYFHVLVLGGAGLTALETGCASGTNELDSSSPDAASPDGAPGSTEAGSGDAGGGDARGSTTCTCTTGSPVLCSTPPARGVCCMWMFGSDTPCCAQL